MKFMNLFVVQESFAHDSLQENPVFICVLVATRHGEINDVFYLLADADISANVKINLSECALLGVT